jgi:hypothetical protein
MAMHRPWQLNVKLGQNNGRDVMRVLVLPLLSAASLLTQNPPLPSTNCALGKKARYYSTNHCVLLHPKRLIHELKNIFANHGICALYHSECLRWRDIKYFDNWIKHSSNIKVINSRIRKNVF